MIASLILQSKGLQDTYLQKGQLLNPMLYAFKRTPTITSHFVELEFEEKADWGRKVSAVIPKNADFVHRCWLLFHVDPVARVDGSYAAYTNSLGHAMIEYVDLYMDNVLIDRHHGEFLEMWSELSTRTKDSDGLKLMLGKTDIPGSLPLFFAQSHDLYVPLQFFFCRDLSMALPLGKLPYQQFRIVVKLRELSEVVTYDGTMIPTQTGPLRAKLLVQYLYVENKDAINQQNKQVIFEQVQRQRQEFDTIKKSMVVPLTFNHPVKTLYWTLVEKDSYDNNDYFHFGNRAAEFTSIAERFRLTLDESELSNHPEAFYRLIVPSFAHTNITNKHIYMYTFSSMVVESNDSTGTLNFSRSRAVQLHCQLKSNIVSSHCFLYVFAVNYNVMVYQNGMAKVLFSS